MIINLGCRLLGTSSDLPGSYPSPSAQDKSFIQRLEMKRATSSSLLGLALKWGLPSPMLPPDRVVSYTTFSPLAFDKLRPVFFLWHFPSLAGPRVTRHFTLESSDFPPLDPAFGGTRGDHLFCFGKSNSLFLTS
jgi:hypothetical protein